MLGEPATNDGERTIYRIFALILKAEWLIALVACSSFPLSIEI